MISFVSLKLFYTKGLDGEKEIISGIIPGLTYEVVKEENDLVYLKEISTKSTIIVTNSMLYSSLFKKMV